MTTTVSTRGRVTIPPPLRRKYGFAPGIKVVWIERDGELVLRPALSAADLFGCLRPQSDQPSLLDVLMDERRAEREREDLSAASLKAAGGLSYADCFSAAAALLDCPVLTGHPEFARVEKAGIEVMRL